MAKIASSFSFNMASFGQLRAQLRALETRTDGLLSEYSTIVQTVAAYPTDAERAVCSNIDENLAKTEDAVGQLTRIVDSEGQSSAAKLHQLQRHREILADSRDQYRRLKGTCQQERNKKNLLSSVQSDIATYRSRSVTPGNEADYMIQERSRIDNSHNLADTLLAQAYETRDEFIRQRTSLANIQRKMLQTASHIPGLNTLIQKVNTRRKRDSLIIAFVITCCILFLFFTY